MGLRETLLAFFDYENTKDIAKQEEEAKAAKQQLEEECNDNCLTPDEQDIINENNDYTPEDFDTEETDEDNYYNDDEV